MSENDRFIPQEYNRASGVGDDQSARDNTQVVSGVEFTPVEYGGKTFNTQEELATWYDSPEGQAFARGEQPAKEATGGGEDDKGQPKPKEPAAKEAPAARTEEEIKASLKEAGGIYADPKYEPFAVEFEKTGELSAESITKAAADFGVSEDMVKQFVAGQAAQRTLATTNANTAASEAQQAMVAAIVGVVPDPAAYEALIDWSRDNVSAAQQKAYNAALDSGNTEVVTGLLEAFQMKANAAGEGKGPRNVLSEQGVGNGQGGKPKGVEPFASQAEMVAAMGDPRYANDPAYNKAVGERVAKSNF